MPWSVYDTAASSKPGAIAAFLETPDAAVDQRNRRALLRVDRNGFVETRPIKGTRPRGVGPEHDAALGQAARRECQGSRREL